MATLTGRRIVEMVWNDLKPSDILTPHRSTTPSRRCWRWAGRPTPSFTCSRWRGGPACALTLDRFDELARQTPLLANIRPSGKYLMEDFYYAGGLRALLARLGDLIHRDA